MWWWDAVSSCVYSSSMILRSLEGDAWVALYAPFPPGGPALFTVSDEASGRGKQEINTVLETFGIPGVCETRMEPGPACVYFVF